VQTLQTLDYWAIAIYMALMAGIGLFLGKYVKNIGDYFKGGNAIPWFSGAISNFMTKFSTFIFVAYAGIAYQHGFVALTLIWSTVLPALVGVLIYAKRWRRAGAMTPMEYLETRFNAPVRQILAWFGVLFKILDNMVRLYALGLFVKAATGTSLEMSILICGIIVALYTVAGGLWAVVITDVVQFVILIVATFILVPLTLKAAGGLSGMLQTIPDHFSWTNGPKGMPLYLSVYYLMILIKYSGNWTFIQRFYSVRDERASQKQGLLTMVFFFVFPVIFLFPGKSGNGLRSRLSETAAAGHYGTDGRRHVRCHHVGAERRIQRDGRGTHPRHLPAPVQSGRQGSGDALGRPAHDAAAGYHDHSGSPLRGRFRRGLRSQQAVYRPVCHSHDRSVDPGHCLQTSAALGCAGYGDRRHGHRVGA
jgi:solute:Na+ symporter, SSS family